MKKLIAIALLALGLAQISYAGTLSSEGGRYVFGQVDANTKEAYMLDTKTGQLWTIFWSDSERTKVLTPVMYYDKPMAAGQLIPLPPPVAFEDSVKK